MDTNPYKDPEGGMEPQPRRRFAVLSRLGWFAAGFVVSWALWSGIYQFRAQPQDMTQAWSEEVRELGGESEMDWMKKAVGRKVGRLVVFTPADRNNASAMIEPQPPHRFPQVLFHDENADGHVDLICVTDAKRRQFTIDLADGQFASYSYSTGWVEEVIYHDGDMDGQFDYRWTPAGRKSEIMVDNQWRQFEHEGDTRYVDLEGVRTSLKLKDGVWRIVEQSNEETQ
jgi:hypothetical protein